MSTVTLRARCPGCTAARAYRALADFAQYPSLTDSVYAVELTKDPDGRLVSVWEVKFRAGILRWSEFDEFDEQAMRISFTRRDGDPADFNGNWQVEALHDGCLVSFQASFDLGITSFAEVVDPLAARTLLENTTAIVQRLLDPGAIVESHTEFT